jgi:hypothetical protein
MPIVVALTGGSANQFLQNNNCGTSVGAGLSCQVNVSFDPSSTGSKTSTLRVTVTGATPSQVNTTVTGTGT